MSGDDQTDTKAWGKPKSQTLSTVATMHVERFAAEYNMSHKNRGEAYIFNHEFFDNDKEFKQRVGTNEDANNLYESLKSIDFNVTVFKDLSVDMLMSKIIELSSQDHTDNDCILIAILSHGTNGYLYAKNGGYKLDKIYSYFTGDNAPTLAGKPKLFLIQACQGNKLDSGVTLYKRTETDNNEPVQYKIPIHADFLIAYSTIPGYYSWRNTTKGSCFIQAICKEINEHGKKYDILTLLTFVSQYVAYNFESNSTETHMHEQKQIPCITTMLTRILRFK